MKSALIAIVCESIAISLARVTDKSVVNRLYIVNRTYMIMMKSRGSHMCIIATIL